MISLGLLPFDAHNHIQLGPPPLPPPPSSDLFRQQLPEAAAATTTAAAASSLSKIGNNHINDEDNEDAKTEHEEARHSFLVRSLGEYIRNELKGKNLCGMAIMATHPRDFATLLDLEREVHNQTPSVTNHIIDGNNDNNDIATTVQEITILPGLGVHPWFLHELAENDWTMVPSTSSFEQHEYVGSESSNHYHNHTAMPEKVPNWIANLESLLAEHPHLPVGEIGLDNFHFDPITQELTSTMDKQVEALTLQLGVATRLHRPVSLHCVRAMGRLMDALEEVAEENYQRLSKKWNNDDNEIFLYGEISENFPSEKKERKHSKNNIVLPPRLYFHAFGGKAATATQLIKTLEKPRRIKIRNESMKRQTQKKFVSVVPPKVYFGFAPPVNFRSPKTASVIKAVGLERLVLETDREDVRDIGPDLEAGIVWISEVLGITEKELVLVTNENARDLYGCCGAGVEGRFAPT